jgi:hypothetical protein
LGYQWLVQVFDRETKAKAQQSYRVLIVDGHGSHVSIKFIEFYFKNKILLAIFLPHATATLQPLDVGVFGPLAQAYSQELSKFIDQIQGFTGLSKKDFFHFFWPAW